jgi:hypothetical protein
MRNCRLVALASGLLILATRLAGGGGQLGGSKTPRARPDHPALERQLALLASDRARTYLGLEGAQVERLRQIAVQAEKANVRTRAEIAVRRIELREALRAEKPERAEILQKVGEISELRGQMMKADVEAILAAKAVLTPAQQRKLLFFLESRQQKEPLGEEENGRRPKPSPAPQAIPIHPGEPPVE